MCFLIGMLVYTALFMDAKNGDPMLFFDQFQDGISEIGSRSKREIDPSSAPTSVPGGGIDWEKIDEEFMKVEKDAVVNFGYSLYLGWVAFLFSFVNLCVAVYASVQRKRESSSHIVMT